MLATHTVGADTLEWSDPITGEFDDAALWTVTSGAGSPPPAAGDSVFFNEAGSYTVTLTQAEAADFLRATSGGVSLLSDSSAARTLDLITGGADLSVRGDGTLNLGSGSNPLVVNVGDRLEVAHGAGGGAGTLNLAGSATELNVLGATTHNFGISGQTAVVNVTDNASLSFVAGSTMAIGRSGSSTSDGRIEVISGGDLVAGNIDIATLTSAAFGSLAVRGAGSTGTQIGSATLGVGSDTGGVGGLTIEDQAVFTSIQADVNPTGRVAIASGGVWNVAGRLTIDAGGEVAIDAGSLDTTTAPGPLGPVLNGLLVAENASAVTGGALQNYAVGSGGNGTLEVRSGSTVTTDFASIGSVRNSVAGAGSVLIDGSGSSWRVTGDFAGNFTIGGSASGSLTVQNGGLALGDQIEVGNLVGAAGDVTVDGVGSRFESTDEMTIGDQGTGTLIARNQAEVVVANRFTVGDQATATATIESGASLSTGVADIGDLGGSNGAVTIDNALWAATAGISVGREGTGSLTLQNGAIVTSTAGSVGASAGVGGPGTGTLDLSGGSSWTMSGQFTVGGLGDGTATIADASSLTSSGGLIGASNTATGNLSVTGTGTTWANHGDLTLGQEGTASLLVGEGAAVTSVNASVGVSSDATSTSSVVVEDAGSQWTASGDLFVAGSSSSSNGSSGDLTVRNGGAVRVDGGTTIYGNGSVTLEGGTLNANGGLDNSAGGTLNLTSGSLNVAGGTFTPNSGGGFAVPSDFHVTLGSGATSNLGGRLTVGPSPQAALSLVDGAQLTTDSGLIRGGNSSSPDSDSAAVSVIGAGSQWIMTGDLDLGAERFDNTTLGQRGELTINAGARVENADANVGFRTLVIGQPVSSAPARVTVSGPGSRWVSTGRLAVGLRQTGRVLVEDQATVESDRGDLGASAIVEIRGAGSRWDVAGLLRVETRSRSIDPFGNGSFGVLIDGGGVLTAGEATLQGVGVDPDDAFVEVSGSGSQLQVAGLLQVGRFGAGNLSVINGARTTSGSAVVGTLDAGSLDGGEKRVIVSGVGSEWLNAGDLAAGGDLTGPGDSGEIVLEDQGTLTVGGSLRVWEPGSVTLDGGALRLDSTQAIVDGTLAFNTGTLILSDAAGYTVGAGEPFVEELIGGTAVVLSPGKSFRVENTLSVPVGTSITQVGGGLGADTLTNEGLVNVHGTTVTTTGILDNIGHLVLIDAAVEGPVDNAAGASITVLGSVGFNGPVSGPGGFFGPGVASFGSVLSPGASPAVVPFEGSVVLTETSELIIELAGEAIGSFDRLVVAGDLTLGGGLRVELLDGFTPELEDVYEFAAVAGDLGGAFTDAALPDLGPVLELHLLLDDEAASLVVAPVLAGDYNADGVVDAADYTVWRDSRGNVGIGLAADGDLDGVVDADDYVVWRTNYGATTPADVSSIPEPTAFLSAVFVAVVSLSRGLGRRSRGRGEPLVSMR